MDAAGVAPATLRATGGQLSSNLDNTASNTNSGTSGNLNPNNDEPEGDENTEMEMEMEMEMVNSPEGNYDLVNGNNKRMCRQISVNSKSTYERKDKKKVSRTENPHRRSSEDLAIDHTLMMERSADIRPPATNLTTAAVATSVATSASSTSAAPVDPSASAAAMTSGASDQGGQDSGETTQKEGTLLGADPVSTTPASL